MELEYVARERDGSKESIRMWPVGGNILWYIGGHV
jgi:hypothetical protein